MKPRKPFKSEEKRFTVQLLKKWTGLMAVTAIFLLNCANAYGRVYIDIDSPGFQKFPIAVTDFVKLNGADDKGKLASWFSDTLGNALNITGYFNVISKKAFLEKPSLNLGQIYFADWSVVGAEYLVKGAYSTKQKSLTAEIRLYDVVKGEIVVGKKYTGLIDDGREIVLRFANEIIYALTGEKGIFDTKIAFVVKKGKTAELHTIRFDGSELVKITDHRALMMAPRWSPGNRQLAFTSYKNNNPDLYIADFLNGRISRVSQLRGLNLAGGWSPDGKKILLTLSKDDNEEIYCLEVATGKLQRLTYNESIDVSPTWSPDGKKIAFVSSRSGGPQIYIMDAGGGKATRISFEGSYNTSPSWSPKGGRIAYESRHNGRFQLFTMKEDGSDPVQLISEQGDCESPSWSPDGRYLVYSLRSGRRHSINVINANGANKRVLYNSPDGCLAPSWSDRPSH